MLELFKKIRYYNSLMVGGISGLIAGLLGIYAAKYGLTLTPDQIAAIAVIVGQLGSFVVSTFVPDTKQQVVKDLAAKLNTTVEDLHKTLSKYTPVIETTFPGDKAESTEGKKDWSKK